MQTKYMLLAANNINLEKALKDTTFEKVSGYGIEKLILTGANFLFLAAGIATFFYLLWGSLEWISSAGDKEALEKAKKKITHALLGLAIVFAVFAIIKLVGVVFGIELLEFDIPKLL